MIFEKPIDATKVSKSARGIAEDVCLHDEADRQPPPALPFARACIVYQHSPNLDCHHECLTKSTFPKPNAYATRHTAASSLVAHIISTSLCSIETLPPLLHSLDAVNDRQGHNAVQGTASWPRIPPYFAPCLTSTMSSCSSPLLCPNWRSDRSQSKISHLLESNLDNQARSAIQVTIPFNVSG